MHCGQPITPGSGAPDGVSGAPPTAPPTAVPVAPATGAPAASPTATSPPTMKGEERRIVSVLFADVSGYTSVAERLDHETVKALIEPFLTRFAAEVERFEGYVDKFIGDAIMAVFGAPVAHTDDPERAVRAALAMQEALAQLNEVAKAEFGVELALRVGVNTGEALAGHVGDAYTVLGDAVNVAARLQAAADVGSVLVGERTHQASAGAIDYRAHAPLDLKGKSEQVAAWEALGLTTSTDPGSRPERESGPIVGRERELTRLEDLFGRVQEDRTPQLVTIVGEPGVGKTRLLNELERRLGSGARSVPILRGRCIAFGKGVVYWPLAEMLRAVCETAESESPAEVRVRARQRLGPLLAAGEEEELMERRLAPLVRLLGVGASGEDPGEAAEADQDGRESFFGAVRTVFEGLASSGPVVLAWEDIHWADDGTLDLIDYLSRWLRAPVLQVCLARDDLMQRRTSWGSARRNADLLFLEPLAGRDAERLVETLLGDSLAAGDQVRLLAERSGGNPFFAEAIVARIAEGEATTMRDLPDTIQGVIAARLDALAPSERALVAQASVLGRTFWESSLESVAELDGAELGAALAALQEKEIVVPGDGTEPGGERELQFKHVLIRDVAYETLPKAARARMHAGVGGFIRRRNASGEGWVGLIAEHYSRAAALAVEAHLPREEVEELRRVACDAEEEAGDAAASLYANAEALAHYEAAAALCDAEDGQARLIAEKCGDVAMRFGRADRAVELWERCLAQEAELGETLAAAELHRKIGAALAQKGDRRAAIEHHQRGINLVKDQPPSLTLVKLYEEAAWLYMQVGDNMLAIYASEKALRLAEGLGELRAASRAHGIFGRVFGRIGDATNAHSNLERAVELARQSDEGETVLALLGLGLNLERCDGDYDGARESYLEALALAERIGEVPAQIELQAALAQIAFYGCEWEQAAQATAVSEALAEREGLLGKLCLSDLMNGRLGWRDGAFAESVELLLGARETAERVGLSETAFDALMALAVTWSDQGAHDKAEEVLAGAVALCERAGLLPQSVRAHASLAIVLAESGNREDAGAAAERAQSLAAAVNEPAGTAAACEALAAVAEPPGGLDGLQEARSRWDRLGRPLELARCELLLGRHMLAGGDPVGGEVIAGAAAMFEQIGIAHLATKAGEYRERAPADLGREGFTISE
jgi:class 3 adenylate cyclase/tetratricopeptide (TPR) repeat protein